MYVCMYVYIHVCIISSALHDCLPLHVADVCMYVCMHQFVTHINGFLEPESSNFDPKYAFLSCLEAEIITFISKKADIFWGAFTAVL